MAHTTGLTNSLSNLGNLSGLGGGTTADYKVSNLYKQAYSDAVRLQIQQFDSLLSDTLTNESIEGEVKSFDKLLRRSIDDIKTRTRMGLYGLAGATTTASATTSDADYGASDTERRMIEPQWFEYAELFDPRDSQGLMKAVRPDSNYLRNLSAIFNQKKDQIILDALTGRVLVQQRTGQGVTVNKTVGYGGLTTNVGSTLQTGITNFGDYKWTVVTGADNDTIDALDGYEGHEIGCKLSRKYENLFAQGETAGTIPDTAAILSGGANNDDTPLITFLPGVHGVGLVSIAGAATLDSLAPADTSTTKDSVGVTPFNVEKLIRARQKLDTNQALMPGQRYICVLHPDQFYSLMADASDTRFTSIDFNNGKPLVGGEAFTYMGFEFRMSTMIPQATVEFQEAAVGASAGTQWDGTRVTYNIQQGGRPVRYAYFYVPACGIFGMNQNMEVRFDEIPERGYALQMWHQVGMNAIRMDGDCIVRVASVDEPA